MTLTETHLVVTIDTEEDNWGVHRDNLTVENIAQLPRLQRFLDERGIVPTYLVTHAVASVPSAVSVLQRLIRDHRCEIGAHLHPWNTPPLTETLNQRNSKLNNLPIDLQTVKLKALKKRLTAVVGRSPTAFRAGRWALGPTTASVLAANAFHVDTSVTPLKDWRAEGNGPWYGHPDTEPYWLYYHGKDMGAPSSSMVEIPATIGFNRWPPAFWERIYRMARHPALQRMHLVGALYRSGLLRKIWFSPEECSAAEMQCLARTLIQHGRHILNITFHSNSLLPGTTPFVPDQMALDRFYQRLGKVIDYLGRIARIRPMTLSEAAQRWRRNNPHSPRVWPWKRNDEFEKAITQT